MHRVVHKRTKKKTRTTHYPVCVLKDGRIRNDEGPTRDHHGVWHYVCWEWWNGALQNSRSSNPLVARKGENDIKWARERMAETYVEAPKKVANDDDRYGVD